MSLFFDRFYSTFFKKVEKKSIIRRWVGIIEASVTKPLPFFFVDFFGKEIYF